MPSRELHAEADSSDEEGAHKPPPPPPEPEPPRPPPLPMPQMGLAKTLGQMSAAAATPTTDESTRTKPRTTRVSETAPHGHRQSFLSAEECESLRLKGQQARRERERADKEMKQTLVAMFANPRVSIYDVLMVEYALQEQNRADPGAMRAAYIKQLQSACHSPPRQEGVMNLSMVQGALLSDEMLRESAPFVITTHKIKYAESIQVLAPVLSEVMASPDETLMQLMTRTRELLAPKLGRGPKSPDLCIL